MEPVEEEVDEWESSEPQLTPAEYFGKYITYWDNQAVKDTFIGKGCQLTGEEVQKLLGENVAKLQKCNSNFDIYRILVADGDKDNVLTEQDKHVLKQKATVLAMVYPFALKRVLDRSNRLWFIDCCNDAVEQMNEMGFDHVSSGKTVMAYNAIFRDTGVLFCNIKVPLIPTKVSLVLVETSRS